MNSRQNSQHWPKTAKITNISRSLWSKVHQLEKVHHRRLWRQWISDQKDYTTRQRNETSITNTDSHKGQWISSPKDYMIVHAAKWQEKTRPIHQTYQPFPSHMNTPIDCSPIREGFKKPKWKFRMDFSMKGGSRVLGFSIILLKNHLESLPDCQNAFCT